MKCAAAVLLLAGLVFGTPILDDSTKYRIDVNHSNVGFAVPISGGLSKVRGKFSEFEMDLFYDRDDITKSSVAVKIKVESIDTGIEARDNHLRTADFFDVANHPYITFKSKKVEKRGEKLILTGDLTMRGVTKEISFPFVVTGTWFNKDKTSTGSGFAAKMELDRTQFGVNYQHRSVPNFIGNKVEIDLNILTRSKKIVNAG